MNPGQPCVIGEACEAELFEYQGSVTLWARELAEGVCILLDFLTLLRNTINLALIVTEVTVDTWSSPTKDSFLRNTEAQRMPQGCSKP